MHDLKNQRISFEEVHIMTDTIRRVDYFCALVPDRPGEGLKILDGLRKAGVDSLDAAGKALGV